MFVKLVKTSGTPKQKRSVVDAPFRCRRMGLISALISQVARYGRNEMIQGKLERNEPLQMSTMTIMYKERMQKKMRDVKDDQDDMVDDIEEGSDDGTEDVTDVVDDGATSNVPIVISG